MEKVLLVEKDQSNKDLSNKDLSKQNFENFDFTGANLTGCNLEECKFINTNFTNANLNGASLINSKVISTNFTNANLTYTNLQQIDFSKYIFERGRAPVLTTNANNFEGANLSNANLKGINISNIVFKGANVNFRNANLNSASLLNLNLIGLDFSNANLSLASLTNSDFTDADFTNADLRYSKLRNSNFTNANFRGVNFANAHYIETSNFTNARNYFPMRQVNPHEIHQEMVKVLNNLPKIFQLMNPNNETVPILNTSLLINEKLDSLINNLQPTANYNEEFLTKLKQNIDRLKRNINGFGDFINSTFEQSYRDYSSDIQNGTMQINVLISYPLFFIEKLTPDTICYYLDDWANGSLTAYDNAVSCAKGICERFVMSVAAALQIYFDENTQNDPVLTSNYGEIISLILNKEYNPSVHYLDASQFKSMLLDKCFQEWYGEHTFSEIAPENADAELEKFKDCVKLKYDALPEKINPSENYEEIIDNYISTVVKITQGGKKRKTNKRKTNKRKTNKRKTNKRKTNKRKTNKRKYL